MSSARWPAWKYWLIEPPRTGQNRVAGAGAGARVVVVTPTLEVEVEPMPSGPGSGVASGSTATGSGRSPLVCGMTERALRSRMAAFSSASRVSNWLVASGWPGVFAP